MENTLKKPMTGIIPPLVTPLLDNDKLDIDGLERLIERLIKGGVHGLFILGTTGEAQSISYRLRHEMIKETLWRAYHFERFGLDSEMWREMGFEWRERFRKVYVAESGLCR